MSGKKSFYSECFETIDLPNTKRRRTENTEQEISFEEMPVETLLKVEEDSYNFEIGTVSDSVSGLRDELEQWSVTHNISSTAMNALLIILQKDIPELPTDSINLKERPTKANHIEIKNGTNNCSTQYNQNNNLNSFVDIFESAENGAQILEVTSPRTSEVLQMILKLLTDVDRKVDSLSTEQKEIKQQINNIQIENRKSQNRLLTKLITQKNSMQDNSTACLLPKKHFNEIAEFEKFEEDLKNSEDMCEKMEEELIQCDISSNPGKYIRYIWRKVVSDEVAKHYSWKGTTRKTPVIDMTFTRVLQSAVNKKFLIPEKHFGAITSKWFQTAGGRVKYFKRNIVRPIPN